MLTFKKLSKNRTKYFYVNGLLKFDFIINNNVDGLGSSKIEFCTRDDMAFKNFIYSLIDEYDVANVTDIYADIESDIVIHRKD